MVAARVAGRRSDSNIARDSAAYAAIVVRTIVNLTKILSRFPHCGRKVPEFDNDDIRELLAYSYRIIYSVQGRK